MAIREAGVSRRLIYLYLPPTPVCSLFVSVYSKFVLLLTSQETGLWVTELEKGGKDAHHGDAL